MAVRRSFKGFSSGIRFFEYLALGISLTLFAVHWFFGVTGSVLYNQFDGALRLVAHILAQEGLTPYQDFGVVYPPGQFFVLGEIFPFTLALRSGVFSLVILTFVLLQTVLLREMKVSNQNAWFRTALATLAVIGSLLFFFLPGDPFPLLLLSLAAFVLHISMFAKLSSRAVHLWLLTIGAATMFFRWDWPIFFLVVQAVALIVTFIISSIAKLETSRLKHWSFALLAYGAGVVLGCIFLFMYLASTNTLSQGLEFMLKIPTVVILPFRQMPPDFTWRIWKKAATLSLGLFFWGSVGLTSLLVLTQKKHFNSLSLFAQSLAIPLAVLPYALGRADWEHALPFLVLTAGSFILASRNWKLPVLNLFFVALLAFPLNTIHHAGNTPSLPWEWNKAQKAIDRELANCRELTVKVPAQSVFVGRTSYTSFVINTAMLYLVRPDLPPATPFITDEPGLQNSCEYGRQIATKLAAAPRPLLSFLEEKPQKPEANATQTMLSCGSIESFLAEQEFKTLGSCQAYGKAFTVRLYTGRTL